MRIALLALPFFLIVSSQARAEITKQQCANLATIISPMGDSVQRAVTAAEIEAFRKIANLGEGPVRDASLRAEIARAKLVEVMREYQTSVEDLAYQLRLCAR